MTYHQQTNDAEDFLARAIANDALVDATERAFPRPVRNGAEVTMQAVIERHYRFEFVDPLQGPSVLLFTESFLPKDGGYDFTTSLTGRLPRLRRRNAFVGG